MTETVKGISCYISKIALIDFFSHNRFVKAIKISMLNNLIQVMSVLKKQKKKNSSKELERSESCLQLQIQGHSTSTNYQTAFNLPNEF